MKHIKKSVSIILSTLMIVSMFTIMPFTAVAAEEITSQDGNYKYKVLDNGTIEITHCKLTGDSVTVPSQIDGYNVTSIGEIAYAPCTEIAHLTISEGIVNIGAGAFQEVENDSSLIEVNLPSTLKTIGACAFMSNTLKKVTIPAGVTEIGDYAFAFNSDRGFKPSGFVMEGARNSAAYEYYEKVADEWGSEKITFKETKKTPINLAFDANGGSGEQTKGKEAYQGYDYTIPECTLTAPKGKVFDHWQYFGGGGTLYPGDVITISPKVEHLILQAVWKPPVGNTGECDWNYDTDTKTLTISGSGVMADYKWDTETGGYNTPWEQWRKEIENVVISEGVTKIGDSAFCEFSKLKKVVTPSTTQRVGQWAFAFCENINEITVNGTDCVIAEDAFIQTEGKEITSIKLNGVHNIDKEAFYNLQEKELDIGGVVMIGEDAFGNNDMLTSVKIPESCLSICARAFSGCSGLETITIYNISCEIYDSPYTFYFNEGTGYPVISGYNGSTAEAYAQKYGRTFISLNQPKISKTKASLDAGKTVTLKVKDGTVKSWTSSNKKVATVSKGKVTALKKGTAIITATLTDGKTLTCKVTVKTSPKLSKSSVSVKKGKTVSVKITGKASSVNNKYTNTKKAKIISKNTATTLKVKGLQKGTTTLKVKVNGVTLKLKVTVK